MQHQNVNFPSHGLATLILSHLKGVELGAVSHNSFRLPGSINIAPKDDFDYYKARQIEVNGKYAAIDLYGEADDLPFADNRLDYIISSHMWEHVPNPIAALLEWHTVLVDGGIVFMIVPLPDAHAPDQGRELAAWGDWKAAYDFDWSPDTVPELVKKAAGGHRGHYFVYSPETLKSLIADAMREFGFTWELIAEENPDTKVGNGFTLVYRVKNKDTRNFQYA